MKRASGWCALRVVGVLLHTVGGDCGTMAKPDLRRNGSQRGVQRAAAQPSVPPGAGEARCTAVRVDAALAAVCGNCRTALAVRTRGQPAFGGGFGHPCRGG
ncbi:MAG: hypothetical protein ACLR4Z_05755 [Butyricicoccaceae bacterium]